MSDKLLPTASGFLASNQIDDARGLAAEGPVHDLVAVARLGAAEGGALDDMAAHLAVALSTLLHFRCCCPSFTTSTGSSPGVVVVTAQQ